MITIKQSHPTDIEVTISNILRYPDIRQLIHMLHTCRRQGSIANLLLEATKEFHGWYAGGPWWSDLTLPRQDDGPLAFERIALVARPDWKIWLQTFVASMACDEIEFFTLEDYSKAREWLAARRDVSNLLCC